MFSDSNAETLGAANRLSATSADQVDDDNRADTSRVAELLAKARRLLANASSEDADEMRELISQLQQSTASGETDRAELIADQLSDLVFYLEDA